MQASAPDLWVDPEAAKKVTRLLARYEQTIQNVEHFEKELDDSEVLLDLADAEDDAATAEEVSAELVVLEARLASLERESLFFGEYDDNAAIVSIHAGAGGVDAQDWAEMLLRMYRRHLDNSGFEVELDDLQPGRKPASSRPR